MCINACFINPKYNLAAWKIYEKTKIQDLKMIAVTQASHIPKQEVSKQVRTKYDV